MKEMEPFPFLNIQTLLCVNDINFLRSSLVKQLVREPDTYLKLCSHAWLC